MNEIIQNLSTNLNNSLNKWDIINLDKLSIKIGDGIHATPKFIENSQYYFINGNNLSNGKIILDEKTYCISESEFNKLFQKLGKFTILYSINGTIGNIAFYNNEPVVLGKSVAFIICPTKTIQIFLYYFLQSENTKNYFDIELTGSTISNLSLRSIRNTPVLLPNVAEQHKIASILITVDNVIEKTEVAIEKYKSIKQGMMHDLFTRGIDPKTNKLRPKYEHAPELYKKSELGFIPDEWKVEPIKLLGNVISGSTPSTINEDFWNGDISWFTPNDLSKQQKMYINKSERLITSKGLVASSNNLIPFNSLIISTRAPIGYLSISTSEFVTNQGCKSVVFFEPNVIEYFYYYLLFYNNILTKYGNGTTFQELSKKDLENRVMIKFPLEPSEQKLITERLLSVDNSITFYQQILCKYIFIKQGLLQDLLTGKRRVKLDELK